METMGNLRHLGLIRAHHFFIDPMASFEEIMRHMPQLNTQDRERDNPERVGAENLNNLYGCSVEMDYPSWGQRRLPATRYPVIFKYCDRNHKKIWYLEN